MTTNSFKWHFLAIASMCAKQIYTFTFLMPSSQPANVTKIRSHETVCDRITPAATMQAHYCYGLGHGYSLRSTCIFSVFELNLHFCPNQTTHLPSFMSAYPTVPTLSFVSEMTYNVSSGTLNSTTIPTLSC